MAVYALTTVITTAWLIKIIQEKEINIARTALDIPIALFFGSQLVSAIFSIDPHVSWFGYYSRFNGGMWSIISYVLLYYAFISHKFDIKKILHITLASAAVVALYGVAERMGIDKHLWVQDVQNRVFSTLGQPNWLAAYLVALIPLTMALGIQKAHYFLLSILFFVVLLFTRSRSGLLGLAVADLVFWSLIFIRNRSALKKPFILIHIAFALIMFINGTNIPLIDTYLRPAQGDTLQKPPEQSGPALESGGTESGTIRKYVWQGAINAWKSTTKTLLIGTGTETFAFAFYQHRPVEHNQTSEWDFLYNKAHNEYLNYLATTGVFGLGSYLLFIGAFIWWFIKKVQSSWFVVHSKNKTNETTMNDEQITINIALFSGWTSILVTNFFGFSVVIVQLFLFLFPLMILTSHTHFSRKITFPRWATWSTLTIGILFLLRIASLWYADTQYASGYRAARSGQYQLAHTHMTRALIINPGEPVYHDEFASTLASLSVAAFESQNATLSAQLASQALRENDRAITLTGANVNFWKTRTKIYYSLASFDPTLIDAAIASLDHAAALSPKDPKIFYNLAILYGRIPDNDKAVEMLKKAILLKPNYRDPYYALYVFYTEMKKPDLAREVLSTYLTTVDSNDSQFMELSK